MSVGADRVCVNCGEVVDNDRKWLCNHCGLPFLPTEDPYDALLKDEPPSLVRTYRGNQESATAAFRKDAEELARRGYVPETQSWAAGQWSCGAFLLALVLAVIVIGLLIFVYMLIVKPDGTLTVTYRRASGDGASAAEAGAENARLADRLAQLDEARNAGLITSEEHAARRSEILERH